MDEYKADVIIAGGGIAGLTAAYGLLKHGKTVIILDKDIEENLGGLAKEAAGGIHIIGTPEQKRAGIKDSVELATRDWMNLAQFSQNDKWQKAWAEYYCQNSLELIYGLTQEIGIRFLPLIVWAERGLFTAGNSVPRWHFTNGTGYELIKRLISAIDKLPQRKNLKIFFEHEVNEIEETTAGGVFKGQNIGNKKPFIAEADHIVIATGGIGGGDLSRLKKEWPGDGRNPPEYMLNGAHKYGDGLLHDKIAEQGGKLSNLDQNWLYAAGVHHPNPRKPFDGMSLQCGPSNLWFNALGKRIGPMPLVSYMNTKWLVDRILDEPGGYTWMIMNWKIAKKELIVSLSRYFTAIRQKKRFLLLYNALFGDEPRINKLLEESPEDVFTAESLPELIEKMQERSLYGFKVDGDSLRQEIESYDAQIDRGPAYHNDEQLRRITNFRKYLPDRMRMCKYQKILDPKAGPLLAVRSFLISRKSLGGIETDLSCRVVKQDGSTFSNIFAIGEAAGYGGGGIHGKGAPEGAFLGGCILTGQVCSRAISLS